MRRSGIFPSEEQGNVHYEAVIIHGFGDLQLSHFLEASLVVLEVASEGLACPHSFNG